MNDHDPDAVPGLRRLGAFALALACAWTTVTAYAVHSALPFNPLRLPFESWIHARFWAPEGWGFFTRDPREEDLFIFVRRDEGGWVRASMGPHAKASNAFGLDRTSRAQGVEAGLLMGKLSKSDWQGCAEEPTSCLERTLPLAASLKNVSPRPTLCGSLGFVLQKPVPWAWSASRARINMPSRVARVDVSC